ncbi:hypothetical protein GGX14DRAFT_652733 [Mycena pura]|uniref:Protein kinase domain-containing protein n=1 Tax=Mycena pura TaxID=153505 RepID=A0AAD6V973_9AGAR|nr:hypothetical protein GGX14DRAFT_652733 [Mycena pura]
MARNCRNILPGREPPSSLSTPSSAPPPVVTGVVPSASSQILPTDSEAIEYPNKTLESVVATGVVGSITTAEREEQRERDAQYCATHVASHVVHSPLEIVLARLSSSAFAEKLTELENVVRTQLDTTLMKAVPANFKKESKASPVDRKINGRYWLSRLADAALEPQAASLLALDYFPNDSRNLPLSKQHSYLKDRKYDACLRPSAAGRSTIFNIFVNVEFTLYNHLVSPLTPSSVRRNVDATLSTSASSSPSLTIASPPLDKLPTVAALLHLFRIASLYQLGYNPLFIYEFTSPSPDSGFSVGDAVPTSVVLPTAQGAATVRLSGKCLSQLRSVPFQRSTVVLEGKLVGQSQGGEGSTNVVVKMSFIAEHRLWRERIIVDALYTANIQTAPVYAPKILAAFAAHGSPPVQPNGSEIMRNKKRQLVDLPVYVPRHLELMISSFDSPPDARKLKYAPSTAKFLAAAVDLFEAILDAFQLNNVLLADNRLVVVDWEMGRLFEESLSATQRGTITGTLDTVSVASFNQHDPLPHDDVESAVYVLLKVLTQTFVPPENLQRDAQADSDAHTAQIFRSAGHATRAELILSLLSLPVRDQRHLFSSDYGAVLLSLQGLVEQAVAAVRSVDASSLI